MLEPHPYYPYLAISGLDNDIKLFMPTADSPTDLSPHAEVRPHWLSYRHSYSVVLNPMQT